MILSITRQAMIFLMTITLGCCFCFLYDVIRIIRRIIPHKNILIQVEDGIYWSFISLMMFYFMLYTSYGEIRVFSVIGVFIGMILYAFIISPIFMKISTYIINFMKKVFLVILNILLMPIKFVVGFFTPTFVFIHNFTRKKFAKYKDVSRKSANYMQRKRKRIFNEIKIILKKH